MQLLARVPVAGADEPFDPSVPGHARDVGILASWFMLRELEVASARHGHLQISGTMVTILIPVHKTDQVGSLTSRTLQCACRIRTHALCPFHAASRHLQRVAAQPGFSTSSDHPLVPDGQGLTMSKANMIDMFRAVIAASGEAVERPDDQGVAVPRFESLAPSS